MDGNIGTLKKGFPSGMVSAMVDLSSIPMPPAYVWTILFYLVVIAVIYRYRKRFEWHGIVGLYRTKFGVKAMSSFGKPSDGEGAGNLLLNLTFPLVVASLLLLIPHAQRWIVLPDEVVSAALIVFIISTIVYLLTILFLRPLKLAGVHAIIIGFLGMVLITAMLVKGLYDLAFVPSAPPVISPVIPGVPILGMGITVPLVIGWLALFLVILVHEFSHGIVARAHNLPVKASGLMVFGPLGGAFVEPDEEKLKKSSRKTQLSVFAAGPFSNVLLAIVSWFVVMLLLVPLLSAFIASDGVVFEKVTKGYPAAAAGVTPGIVYDRVNNVTVSTYADFSATLEGLAPNDTVVLESSRSERAHVIVATSHPENASRGYLGVIQGVNLKEQSYRPLYDVLYWFVELFTWTFLLSLGIGLANLLPLGPVDGGRMLQVVSEKWFGEKVGKSIWTKITIIVIVVLAILLIVPFLKAIF